MLLGGLFQAWRSVCRGGASDLPTGERCVFQRRVPARAAGYALCVPDEKRVLRRPTNGCLLKKQSVARSCRNSGERKLAV